MKNKKLVLILGESTGVECLRVILRLKLINVSHVISVNQEYNRILRNICKKNNIYLSYSKSLINKKISFKKQPKTKLILISIFSNLILGNDFLKKFNNRCYNLHPGLLPYYPGKNCVSGSIYNLEKKTGITLHKIIKKVDQGKIVYKKTINVDTKNDSLIILMNKLKKLSSKLIKKFIKDIHKEKKFILRNNNIRKKKAFPKFIPNEGLITSKTSFKDFNKMYRASDSGPFNNSWGKIFFKYKNSNKKISNYNLLDKKLKFQKFNKDITKIGIKLFIIKLRDNIIKVKIF